MIRIIIVIFIAVSLLISCSALNVNSDFDTEFDFSKFSTFKIVNKSSNKADAKKPTSISFNRVSRAVEKELKLRGMNSRDTQPDCIVTFHTSVEKKLSVETTNYRRWRGYWVQEQRITEYQHGLLVIDIINRETKNVVWRGWANGISENSTRSQEEVNEIVSRIMSNFPPKGG